MALWQAMQQILIGIALGFTMQFAFAAVRTAGELIGLQMGLSFATFFDRQPSEYAGTGETDRHARHAVIPDF